MSVPGTPRIQVGSLADIIGHLEAIYDRLRALEQPQQDHVKPAEGQPPDQPQQGNPPPPYPQQAI